MDSFLKITDNLPVNLIVNSLEKHPELWDQNPQRRISEGSPHNEMVDIWARFGDISDGNLSRLRTEHDSIWYPFIDKLNGVKDICFTLMSMVDGERLGGVLITKLPAGKCISPHVDSGWHAQYYEKFYVALRNDEGSIFGFNDGEIKAESGDCYLFRNDRLHWVNNFSNSDRLSMIVCIKTDKFKVE